MRQTKESRASFVSVKAQLVLAFAKSNKLRLVALGIIAAILDMPKFQKLERDRGRRQAARL